MEKYSEEWYQSRSDARTLIEAGSIKHNKKRMAAAKQAAKEMYNEKAEELKEIQKMVKNVGEEKSNNSATIGQIYVPKGWKK